jgi:hypothetical protein
MPQSKDSLEVTFTIPVQNNSPATSGLRTVHVIIPRERSLSNAEVIIRPLIFLFPRAALLVFILLKIRAGKKTDTVLNTVENITDSIEEGLENGIRKF